MAGLQRIYNPLAFPASVAPGFDPTHIASNKCLASTVSSLGGLGVNLLSGSAGTLSTNGATNSNTIIGPLGMVTKVTVNGWGNHSIPAIAHLPVTLAAIFSFSSVASAQNILSTGASISSSGSGGWRFGMSTAGSAVQLVSNGVTAMTFSGLTIVANIPYFYVASASSTKSAQVFMNLASGQIFSTTSTGSGTPSADVGFNYPGVTSLTQAGNLNLAAGMYNNNFMPLSALLLWAADPWAFWYPRRQRYYVGQTAAAAFNAYWASNNLPVLGTGTY